jgi:hypothetical protein
MSTNERISNYLDLLKIRQAARERDARILGYICLFAFLATIGFGLVSGLGGREVYLVVGLNVVFGLVFLVAWVRLEIVNAIIELLQNF